MIAIEQDNYRRIEHAIRYIRENFRSQPSLDEVAAQVQLSPFHFQKLFSDWAGVSPKKFLQFTSIHYAKQLLRTENLSLFDTAENIGLSGTGRLHDLFVSIEGMTPGEYKNEGASLQISYSFTKSLFGSILVASTQKGICFIAFADDEQDALNSLIRKFPKAVYMNRSEKMHQGVCCILNGDWTKPEKIKLHLKGTAFQLKVWEALLKIPEGKLSTYGAIANQLSKPLAARAVGTAIGDNPVAFVVPCHRVIQGGGQLGGYHWGIDRKSVIIGWEASKNINRQ